MANLPLSGQRNDVDDAPPAVRCRWFTTSR
jgi:hypothetical protein